MAQRVDGPRPHSDADGADRETDSVAVSISRDPSLPEDPIEDLGGQADIADGPGRGVDGEPTVAALRAEILEKVAAYSKVRWTPQRYVPGKTPAPYAGRIFDENEVLNLVDASLDFWLTSGRFCRQLEKGLADFVGVTECRLVNSGSLVNLLSFSTMT